MRPGTISNKSVGNKKISGALVSVVIPVYNEGAKALKNLLSSLTETAAISSRVEIIVVDGGSQDDTMEALQKTSDSGAGNPVRLYIYMFVPFRYDVCDD